MVKPKPSFTTLRVTPETRDIVNAMAQKGNVSVEDLLRSLMAKDMTKQILLTMDAKKYYGLIGMARLLKEMNFTDTDKIEDMFMFALEFTMENVMKKLEKINNPSGMQPTNPLTANETPLLSR